MAGTTTSNRVLPALLAPTVQTWVRSRFPALATEWALFDNAGGSVPLAGVVSRVHDHMLRLGVQLGASYPHSVEATERVAGGHRAAECLLNAPEGTVVLGPSTTANLRTLAHALGATFATGDEIVVTNLDHESNIGAWRMLESRGIVVREWRLRADTQRLHVEDLAAVLNSRTRLVAFTHCANIVGSIHDAKQVIDRVHAAGALACVDGVAYAPHRLVDVQALGADFYVVSLYKMFGPHLGMMYVKAEHLARVKSQNHFFLGDVATPYKLEPGGVPHELASAPMRPRQLFHYDGVEDLAALAVRLMMAVVTAHPFEQGNKRTGFAAAEVFLEANGWLLDISDFEDVADEIIEAADDGSLEADLVELFGRNLIEMA